jgi:hypothetical protein
LSELVFEDSLHPKLKTEKGGRIISDTTKVIVLSGMLKRSVNESEYNVRFTESIRNVRHFIDEYIEIKSSEKILLYMDFPVDNDHVIEGVLDIVNVITKKKLLNIVPILIPCIEYYAIMVFGNKESIDYSVVCDLKKYRDTDTCKCNVSKTYQSFEKYCKAVFSKIVPIKYHGAILVDEFENIIDDSECVNLLHSLPAFEKSYTLDVNESELIHLTCMNQLGKMVKQSREYIEYNVNCELINELQEVFEILYNLWKTM